MEPHSAALESLSGSGAGCETVDLGKNNRYLIALSPESRIADVARRHRLGDLVGNRSHIQRGLAGYDLTVTFNCTGRGACVEIKSPSLDFCTGRSPHDHCAVPFKTIGTADSNRATPYDLNNAEVRRYIIRRDASRALAASPADA